MTWRREEEQVHHPVEEVHTPGSGGDAKGGKVPHTGQTVTRVWGHVSPRLRSSTLVIVSDVHLFQEKQVDEQKPDDRKVVLLVAPPPPLTPPPPHRAATALSPLARGGGLGQFAATSSSR